MHLTETTPSRLATRSGKLTLALLCAVAFLDFVDASIVNVALPSIRRSLHSALLNASQQLGGALGLAIFTAVATSRTNHLLAGGAPVSHALTGGFQRALLVGSIFILASAVVALRATNTRGEADPGSVDAEPEASPAA